MNSDTYLMSSPRTFEKTVEHSSIAPRTLEVLACSEGAIG